MTKRIEGAKKGRPTLYSEELAWRIANRIADGKTLAEVCRMPDTPALMTVLQWQREKPDFHSLLMRAREAQAETWFDDMRNTSITAEEDGVRSAQLKINTMQWMMARMYPKKFSERVLAEMAKIPEPVKEAEPEVDTAFLTFEERETFKQLIMLANARKNGTLIEHQAREDEDDGDDGADREDDQSGDPASGR